MGHSISKETYQVLIDGFMSGCQIYVAAEILFYMMNDANIVPDGETFDRVIRYARITIIESEKETIVLRLLRRVMCRSVVIL